MLLSVFIYGGMLVCAGLGCLIAWRRKVGVLFLLTFALFALLLLMGWAKGDAKYGTGEPLTTTSFTLVFLWLPTLWTGFVISTVAAWVLSALRNKG